MSATAKGVSAAVLSNALFAVLFLYGGWMQPMGGTDIFAWRMVSMLLALCGLIGLTGGWRQVWNFLRTMRADGKLRMTVWLTTPILASQLWLFMWAPVNGEGLNVAMGYFLFPLAMMLAGRLWFGDRLNALQKAAVGLACLGVAAELWRTGAFSWATVWVFGTYPVYYLLRRKAGVPSLIGLLLDLAVIAPCMLVYLLTVSDSLTLLAAQPSLWWFVALLGLNSAVAMYLNLQANALLPVTLFGMLSYLEPVLLFAVSLLWLGEQPEAGALWSYGLIWAGLCVMLADGALKMRMKRSTR
ncbi:EamA family transporter RarD [Bergeriella denitrificans]|uniref:Putative chloramphenical resistance permease RarD n=1 Tax=Bergeriella denitrificans TaxID=494 RepID=A0A378UDV4_BERDE|nr:EamA family transporter RarD [Bergeriella denitrificans]STZ75350.1 putative chloramphenical resistance permease RarD [Bergeriella denitrificans]